MYDSLSNSSLLHILAIDDSKLDMAVYQQMLNERNGYRLQVVGSGRDGLEYVYNNSDIDCILLDLHMPDMSGKTTLENIVTFDSTIPVVVVTGDENDEKAIHLLQNGAEDYLIKGEYNQKLLSRSIHYAIERKKAKQETQRLSRDLQQERSLNNRQKEFVSMVSHEFRTPLAVINSSVQLLERHLKEEGLQETSSKHLRKIAKSVERMNGLIDNALYFTQLESNLIEYTPQSFNFYTLLKDVMESFEDMSGSRQFITEGDPIPQEFYGDPKLCEHIFSNLISNAIKYSDDNSTITISTHIGENEIAISIKDQGTGISKDELAHVGQKFFRASNSTGIAGSGIGLYLIRSFLKMSNGTMKIDSDQGKGTTVTVTMPYTQNQSINQLGGAQKHA